MTRQQQQQQGRHDGSSRGWRRPALAAALLLLAACASEHPAPVNCSVDPKQRPLGAKTGPFLEWLGDWPHLAGKEVGGRSAMLGDDWKSYSGRLGDDATATGEHARNFGSFTSNECSTHGSELENFFESQGDRMREDGQCFFARAWHSLKLIE